MMILSRRLLLGALMLFLLTSACNYPKGTPVPLGTILPAPEQVATTAISTVSPTETLSTDTAVASIPNTGMKLVSQQCQFCVNDEAHAVLIMPQAASFLVSQPVTGVNCLTAQVVNGQRIVVCHGKQAAFTLNVCMNGSDCTQLPVTLQNCALIPQTGAGTLAPTSTTAPVILPTNTAIPPTLTAPTQVPSQIPTQTNVVPPPAATTGATHAEPTRSSRMPVPTSGNRIQDPAAFITWYFGAVWQNRNYQVLWNNYLTPSFKTVVSPGGYSEYIAWWGSVQSVDVNSVNVIQNDGTHAVVRVNITFNMKDGRVISNQEYDYDLLYDAARQTWMFDVHS